MNCRGACPVPFVDWRRITRLNDLFDSCFLNSGLHFLDRRLSITSTSRQTCGRGRGAEHVSGALLPPSPPAEKANARQYEARNTVEGSRQKKAPSFGAGGA